MEHVTDPSDPRIAAFRAVRERDLVAREGRFIAEGEVVLRGLVQSRRHRPLQVLIDEKRLDKLMPLLSAQDMADLAVFYAGLESGAAAPVQVAALPPFLGSPWWLGVPGLLSAVLIAWLALRRGVLPAVLAAPLLYWSVLQLELPNLPALWIAPRAVSATRRWAPR